MTVKFPVCDCTKALSIYHFIVLVSGYLGFRNQEKKNWRTDFKNVLRLFQR